MSMEIRVGVKLDYVRRPVDAEIGLRGQVLDCLNYIYRPVMMPRYSNSFFHNLYLFGVHYRLLMRPDSLERVWLITSPSDAFGQYKTPQMLAI